MITEDYVSFEIAKLLKEKGFEVPYDSFRGVYINGEFKRLNPGDAFLCNDGDEIIKVCSLQMAMKWLRENYNIHITAVPNGIGEDVFYMGIYRKYDYGWTYISDCLDEEYKEAEFHTPEEACEAAIKYCLENLI
jgi:hypothetical protein